MKAFVVVVLIVILSIGGYYVFSKSMSSLQKISPKNVDMPTQTPKPYTPENFTASFEIYTLGTKRIFTDSKYHKQSEDVFITAENPSNIIIKKQGVTWGDFFETLPMKLTTDCLTTGTGQVFCTNENQELSFSIDGIDSPDALTQEIFQGQVLVVTYK